MVNADRQQISQVIFNIIDNAINFILNEGSISIFVEQKVENEGRNMVIVRIKDNGEGIHPDMNSRLFTKFSSKSYHGSGLGLYISKEIIQRHNGTIWGKNNQDGKGATFSFKLLVIWDADLLLYVTSVIVGGIPIIVPLWLPETENRLTILPFSLTISSIDICDSEKADKMLDKSYLNLRFQMNSWKFLYINFLTIQ